MGTDKQMDTPAVQANQDVQADPAFKADPIKSLGGDLLVIKSVGKVFATDGQDLHVLIIAGLDQAQAKPAPTVAEGRAKIISGDRPQTISGQSTAGPADKAGPKYGGDMPDHPPTALELEQKAYDQAHGQFDKGSKKYWDGVAQAKKAHRFVMEFPPIYTGPDKPKVPGQPPAVVPNSVPTIRQMIEDSKSLNRFANGDKHQPDFELRQVGEAQFKQRYAQEALIIGKQYGINKDQMKDLVRGIYAFEDGGWGTHETLSSMPPSLVTDDRPAGTTSQTARLDFHVAGVGASSALGYNQLLTATTMQDIQFQSQPIADRLNQIAKEDPSRSAELEQKARLVTALGGALDRELMAMANAEKGKKPEDQKKYLDADGKPTDLLYRAFLNSKEPTAGGQTRQDMARAVQSLNLDGDIGPIIQATELGNLLKYDNRFDYGTLLQGKEISDKQALAAYDALSAVQKEQAVHDLLDRLKPPVVKGTNASASGGQTALQEFNDSKTSLEQKMLALKPGVDSTLSPDSLTKQEAYMMRNSVLTAKKFGDPAGPLSPQADLLLNKVTQSFYGGLTAATLTPAALELANLAGPKNAQAMIDAHNQDVPTPNFFSRAGYTANPVVNGRTGSELLLQIKRIMSGPSYSPAEKKGQADFEHDFDQAP